ncbi:helix-turn-helix transcriptional regulator [Sphingobacterium sp. DN00404]|uniref:Helix-turn-helix transcriptional regulator n=2 Tax=Sphingobacterium micropteri TaxID=2763501 RepID=A0ABR7YUS4_9SPHI|nr:helix-turn-helix transcriptional regulator [Sphingobacterium micropteri]
MNMLSILRETTPLSEKDCFMVFTREKTDFDFPVHVHPEYELNFIENAKGAQRIMGDSIEEIENIELALVTSSNLEHGWMNHRCVPGTIIKEITIQFHPNLLNDQLLNRNQFRTIQNMFAKAAYGISFSETAIEQIKTKIYDLAADNDGFYSVMKLIELLYELSHDTAARMLSSRSFHAEKQQFNSRRVERIIQFLMENYTREVTLGDVSDLVGMTAVSVSRFLKLRTGRSFVDTLNDIRLGHASRRLIDTTHSVAEIALQSGFNNLSNFNRIFLKKKGCTPSDFRNKYRASKFFL